ncbi:MAG: bifunctional folylpolyglutamate synthase/dihydrofolate synthase [Verrucomicrobia bacterium]|nr:bifunctional folylpolyglutamate synthase/dihydrofolate synthase [Verrucomicrobiota bacterium]
MTYSQAIQCLYALRLFGAKFGLENTRRLAALAGNDHERLRFIHVAGTNGKGSVCAMLESVYRAAGLRTGLFTSPHLVSFAERIQVNRRLIPPEEVVRLVGEVRGLMATFAEDHSPTFFEAATVMAFRYFAEQQCDLVLLETGLGGRLDATNIVTPLASVITNIGAEHQQWLGDTLDQIAAEKAGIIKPRVPVVTAACHGEGLEIIAGVARRHEAPLTVVEERHTRQPPLDGLTLPLPGHHQLVNAATAIATVRTLAASLPVSPDCLAAGLAAVQWPGRLQHVRTASGQVLILDAAHNPPGAEALRAALLEEFPEAGLSLVFGVFQDKDWRRMCRSLVPLARRILLAPVHSDRSQNPAELAPYCRTLNASASIEVCDSLSQALSRTAGDPRVVVTGSVYLVGEALEQLHLAPSPPDDEKGLNDWTARR